MIPHYSKEDLMRLTMPHLIALEAEIRAALASLNPESPKAYDLRSLLDDVVSVRQWKSRHRPPSP